MISFNFKDFDATDWFITVLVTTVVIAFLSYVVWHINGVSEKYKVILEVQYCTSKTDTVEFVIRNGYEYLYISNYKKAVPELRQFTNETLLYNVCGFKVLSETKLN